MPGIDLNDCIELGVLGKPHGIRGHIVLKLNKFSFDDIQEMELAFIIIDGLPVPFFIEEFQEKTTDTLLILFDTVNSETLARKLSECRVYIEKKYLEENSLTDKDFDSLPGYTVIDRQKGNIGLFDSVVDFDSNVVIRVLRGNTEIFIPLQAGFITDINHQLKEIQVDCPDGLLDLYY
ncbi:MAG: hypothetical protein JXB34_01905 [Bacteroidales bacterium]|nr:hypothetical protein [Bacteroidales bacterium]